MESDKKVNAYRFLDRITRKLVKDWIRLEAERDIPWTPLARPLDDCNVALVSSAGLALKNDRPFDQDGERENPWWGDPSYRIIPREATSEELELYHLHIAPRILRQDINTFFPLQRLMEFEASGEIGRSAPRHYSYMGYILQPEELLQRSVPAMIRNMQQDQVDVVVLVPG